MDEYEAFVRKERGIPIGKKLKRKVGCDGGGIHFKVTMNLVEEEEMRPGSPSNPKKQKKRHEYLSSSVKATLLLAVIECIPETRANVKKIFDYLNLQSDLASTINSDLKLINIIVGIQGHQSSCPCPYCEWLKKDGVTGEPAELRTPENIR